MTERYTAADFANARFAEHPDGRLAHRIDAYQWRVGSRDLLRARDMPASGWVPVPTKPQITESQVNKELDGETKDFEAGFHYALAIIEAEIIPEPEPTNTERLAEMLDTIMQEGGWGDSGLAAHIAEHLVVRGVTTPKKKGK